MTKQVSVASINNDLNDIRLAELRMSLLQMAKQIVEVDYYSLKESLFNDWNERVRDAHAKSEASPRHPIVSPFPSAFDIVEKAKILETFIFNR